MTSMGEVKRLIRERATHAARVFSMERAKAHDGIEAAARRRSAAQAFSDFVRTRHKKMFKNNDSSDAEVQIAAAGIRASRGPDGHPPLGTPETKDVAETTPTAALSPPNPSTVGMSGEGARCPTTAPSASDGLEKKAVSLERVVAAPHPPMLPATRVFQQKARRLCALLADRATSAGPGVDNGRQGGVADGGTKNDGV